MHFSLMMVDLQTETRSFWTKAESCFSDHLMLFWIFKAQRD